MAAIKVSRKNATQTLKLQTNLGIINELYSGKNKWLISRMDGTKAMKWRPPQTNLEDGL